MKLKFKKNIIIPAALMLSMTGILSSCEEKTDFNYNAPASKPSIAFVALTNTTTTSTAGQLVRYNSSNSASPLGAVNISTAGLQTGESIVAIDYRPATGTLYGLGSSSRLYILNPLTGAARAVSATAFTPALSGAVAAFDFNPTVDRIRVVTTSGQNLRLNPDDGTVVANDAAINGVAGAIITGAAYTNNKSGATSTELYDLDIAAKKLYKQDANAGTLTEVGNLGLSPIVNTAATYSAAYNTNITTARTTAAGGFDIAASGEALAVMMNNSAPAIPIAGIAAGNPSSAVSAVAGTANLFQINLETGAATDLGTIGFLAPSGGLAATALIGIAIAPAPVAYAVDEENNLLIFDPTKPEPVSKKIENIQPGETILGLDTRPLTGQLYALGSSSRIYTINPASGAATAVGALPMVPLITGDVFGFDFNPTADAIRIVSNTGLNLRVNPTTGIATADGNIVSSAEVTAAAYTNNVTGSTSTRLYVIDSKVDSLYEQNPSTGALTRVGRLGIDVTSANGFDIGGTSALAYAILTTGSETKLYRISLTAGTATPVIAFPKKVRGFTLGLGF